MLNIYNTIVGRFEYLKQNGIPISNLTDEFGFVIVNDSLREEEFFKAIIQNTRELLTIRVFGSDHVGELQYRKDICYNAIEYVDENGKIYSSQYMYLMD